MNSVFFGQEGMTSTSANYYANIAKELQEAAAERLNNLRFFNASVAVIGSDNKQLMIAGNTDLNSIEEDLQMQSSMFTFCAWVREAIKVKEEMQRNVQRLDIEAWAEEQGITLPESPKYPATVEDPSTKDVIDSWDINKRTRYLRLDTFAAHYGKLIHPKGAYSNARKEAHTAVNQPIVKEGAGRDMVLYYREPSVDIKKVDSKFLELQDKYRQYEKELNQMKAEIQDTINELTRRAYEEYQAKIDEWKELNKAYNSAWAELRAKYNTWKTNELERISKLKITIPDNLKATFKVIREVGDTSK